MYYFSEVYSPKPSWLALSQEERFTFFAKIEAGMSALAESGVEILTMSVVDKNNLFSPTPQFFALWKFPTQESLNALLEGAEATGWHNYFETINIVGGLPDEQLFEVAKPRANPWPGSVLHVQ